MTTIFILYLFTSYGHVTATEFTTQSSCEQALEKILFMRTDYTIEGVCLMK